MNTLTESQINLAHRSRWMIPKSAVTHDRNTPSKRQAEADMSLKLEIGRAGLVWHLYPMIRIDLSVVKRVTRL